jgi:hypothetical protein
MVRPATQDRLVILGCRVCQTVTAVARAATTRVLLVAMVPWAGIMEEVLPPFPVRSHRVK